MIKSNFTSTQSTMDTQDSAQFVTRNSKLPIKRRRETFEVKCLSERNKNEDQKKMSRSGIIQQDCIRQGSLTTRGEITDG